MGKGKQIGSGHMPLTHYERTKKFASSGWGSTTTRISGDTQVAFGHCSLGLTPIVADDNDNEQHKGVKGDDTATTTTIAMVSPSGHLYATEAIYEYLLTKTQEYQAQMVLFEKQKQQDAEKADTTEATKRQRQDAFEASNNLREAKRVKTATSTTSEQPHSALKRTSFWLPDMQPDKVDKRHAEPERPASPYSGVTLRRKDLRKVALQRKRNSQDVLCAISGKPIRLQAAMAYWTKDKTVPGVIVLKDVFHMTIDTNTATTNKRKAKGDHSKSQATTLLCPITNSKIKHTIELKSGGSGFAAHNAVEVKTYKPTIT
jgi:hypothetical protein